ncbi:MAG TPA: class F sortase [Xanthomonadales bacterium]|nr:class F sortase [Xanthomonadales bacterium]
MKKLFVLLLIATGAFFGVKGADLFKAESREVVRNTQAPNESQESNNPEEEAVVPGIPQTILIPKININAVVEAGGIDSEKKPVLPTEPDNVVWYNLGPKPGEVGSSVLSGHWDRETGAPAVFYDLKKLEIGDEITIEDSENQKFTFTVTKKVDYPFDKVPLQEVYAASTDKQLLNLITCAGTWNPETKLYSSRTVIYTELTD